MTNNGSAKSLPPKQRRFVEEYLVDLNARQAAIRARYSERTAQEQGSRLLSKAKVQTAVAKAMAERSRRTKITADYVLAGLQEIAERSMQRVPVLDRLGNETGQWTFKAGAATRAFELMGKHLGMFVDRHEHSGPGGVVPKDDIVLKLRFADLGPQSIDDGGRTALDDGAVGHASCLPSPVS